MGFVNAVRGIIEKFRGAGKSEKEISSIIEEASEKATVNRGAIKEKKQRKQEIKVETKAEVFIDAILQEEVTTEQAETVILKVFSEIRSSQDRKKRRNTNNWRKMHGMPMRRKWKAGKRNARRKRADCY